MINRAIKRLLLNKLKISSQALSLRAKSLKSKYGPMSTEEATYVIAHQNGIDLSKYLSIELIDRVRSFIPRELPKIIQPKQRQKVQIPRKKKYVISYPLVKNNMLKHGIQIGGETFPQVFALENSIRNLIILKLHKQFGKDWWLIVSKHIRDQVQIIIDKEKKFPYRPKRGYHPIYYSNFAHLKDIILQNQNLFTNPIIDFQWFKVQMDQVYMARNTMAHCNLIAEDDRITIRLFYNNWARLLESAGFK